MGYQYVEFTGNHPQKYVGPQSIHAFTRSMNFNHYVGHDDHNRVGYRAIVGPAKIAWAPTGRSVGPAEARIAGNRGPKSRGLTGAWDTDRVGLAEEIRVGL